MRCATRRAIVMAAAIQFVTLALLAIPVLSPAARSAPAVKPVLRVDLWPADQSLNASYDTQGLSFSGRLTLDNAPYAKYEVFLKSADNPSWAASCTPDYIVFWGSDGAGFNISVTVPQLAANQTAKLWVESRATCQDTDVAGNVSAPVFITVGALPSSGNGTHAGDPFFGTASGGAPILPMALLAVLICAVVVSAYSAIRWQRRRKAGPG